MRFFQQVCDQDTGSGKATGYDQGFGHFIAHEGNTLAYPDLSQIHATAERWLDDRTGSPEPFFLYLAYNAPHFPIQPPADWLEKVRNREPQLDGKRAANVAFVEHLDAGRLDLIPAAAEFAGTDAATGEVKWTIDVPGRAKYEASPLAVDGKIYVIDFQGEVAVIDAENEAVDKL